MKTFYAERTALAGLVLITLSLLGTPQAEGGLVQTATNTCALALEQAESRDIPLPAECPPPPCDVVADPAAIDELWPCLMVCGVFGSVVDVVAEPDNLKCADLCGQGPCAFADVCRRIAVYDEGISLDMDATAANDCLRAVEAAACGLIVAYGEMPQAPGPLDAAECLVAFVEDQLPCLIGDSGSWVGGGPTQIQGASDWHIAAVSKMPCGGFATPYLPIAADLGSMDTPIQVSPEGPPTCWYETQYANAWHYDFRVTASLVPVSYEGRILELVRSGVEFDIPESQVYDSGQLKGQIPTVAGGKDACEAAAAALYYAHAGQARAAAQRHFPMTVNATANVGYLNGPNGPLLATGNVGGVATLEYTLLPLPSWGWTFDGVLVGNPSATNIVLHGNGSSLKLF